jgi:hypothetical protein
MKILSIGRELLTCLEVFQVKSIKSFNKLGNSGDKMGLNGILNALLVFQEPSVRLAQLDFTSTGTHMEDVCHARTNL